jgi:hypothetical protein
LYVLNAQIEPEGWLTPADEVRALTKALIDAFQEFFKTADKLARRAVHLMPGGRGPHRPDRRLPGSGRPVRDWPSQRRPGGDECYKDDCGALGEFSKLPQPFLMWLRFLAGASVLPVRIAPI